MMQTGLITCPADVGQLVVLVDEVMNSEKWRFMDDLESYSPVQVSLIEKAMDASENPWELMAVIANVSGFLIAGCGTLAMIRSGMGEAGGVFMGQSMS